jgi:hypothetical protein
MLGYTREGGQSCSSSIFGRQFLREPQVCNDMDVRGGFVRAMQIVNSSAWKIANQDSMRQHLQAKSRCNGGKRRT